MGRCPQIRIDVWDPAVKQVRRRWLLRGKRRCPRPTEASLSFPPSIAEH